MFPKLRKLIKDLAEEDYLVLREGIILILLVGGIAILVLPFLFTLPATLGILDYSNKGEVGDTVNGVAGPFIAILGVFITFLAFYIQYKANQIQIKNNKENKEQFEMQLKQQQIEARKNEIENRYFKMLEFHRENVSQTASQTHAPKDVNSYKTGIHYYHGLAKNMEAIVSSVRQTLYSDPIIEELLARNVDKYIPERISYRYLYHGGVFNDEYLFCDVPWKDYYELLAEGIIKTRSEYTPINLNNSYLGKMLRNALGSISTSEGSEDVADGQYKGAGYVLGHYFRHLFLMVKYIDDTPDDILSSYEKYRYIKMLRAQLSSSEQILLFYNSIYSYGMEWELKYHEADNYKPEKWLLTKYNLLKNIPSMDEPLDSVYKYLEFHFWESLKDIQTKRRELGFYVSE